MRDHRTDVASIPPRAGAQWAYVARCSCGWTGARRPTRYAADEDAHAHVLAAIPDDMPGSVHH